MEYQEEYQYQYLIASYATSMVDFENTSQMKTITRIRVQSVLVSFLQRNRTNRNLYIVDI